jgi:opacity protein-like surface antigen
MSPTRWSLPRAISLSLLAALVGAATASAQYYDPALRSLDLSTGSAARSPRLLGMGGLSVVIPDRETQINLWDLARMPVGLGLDDSTSSMDVRPGTGALSSVRRLGGGRDRQNLAARTNQTTFEAVYRNRETGGSFGVLADVSSLRWDRPYSSNVEVRQGLGHPEVMTVLGGIVPRFFHSHLLWAAHVRFRGETVEDEYRSVVSNIAGEWIDLGGTQLEPPSEFIPTKVTVTTSAYGLSTAYSIGKRGKFALGFEHEWNRIVALNELARSASETQEQRPYWVGRAAIIGGIGRTLEFGVEGTGRVSDSERDWRFTPSAGVGQQALNGRGNMLTRNEKSSEMHARVRWTPGKAVFAGQAQTAAYKILIDPPDADDPTSLNLFMNRAFNRPNADSLVFPDSIVHDESRRWAFAAGGGVSYPFGRTLVGAEYHWSRDAYQSLLIGAGPRRIAWDVRTGLERPLGTLMKIRLGYAYRWVDEDDYSALDEYVAHDVSIGLGYAPSGSKWSLESGYQVESRSREQDDPADERQKRHHLAMQVHWAF